jgi:hypothetical protein
VNSLRIAVYITDDEYLRSIDKMVESIQESRKEPIENGVILDKSEMKISEFSFSEWNNEEDEIYNTL